MCTVTWWREADAPGYEVFFNRDERRARGAAAPPTRAECFGVNYIAPTDSDYRGTWLLVNDRGLTLGLVNHYPKNPAQSGEPPMSRGRLLRGLADTPGAEAVAGRLDLNTLRRCSAFHLLAFGLGESPRRWRWDSRELHDESALDPLPFLSASSFKGAEIGAHRRELFARDWAGANRLSPDDLAQFHRHREPGERSPWGILMDRPDARTVSFSHLVVGPGGEAVFEYFPRAKEDGAEFAKPVVTRLKLRRA